MVAESERLARASQASGSPSEFVGASPEGLGVSGEPLGARRPTTYTYMRLRSGSRAPGRSNMLSSLCGLAAAFTSA